MDSLTHRLERLELLSELLLQCAQSRPLLEGVSLPNVAGGRGRKLIPTVRSSQGAGKGMQRHQMGQPFMSVFAAFVNGQATETAGTTGLAEVEVARLNEFRKQLTSATEMGRFLEMWNIRETHPKGGSVRTPVRYRMRTPGTPAVDKPGVRRCANSRPVKLGIQHRASL